MLLEEEDVKRKKSTTKPKLVEEKVDT